MATRLDDAPRSDEDPSSLSPLDGDTVDPDEAAGVEEDLSGGGSPSGEPGDHPGQLDITRITGRIRGPLGAIAVSTSGLFLLAVFFTLYVGKDFFLPITLAVMLNYLLTPAVRWLKKL
ncbi:MAG: hypothetical protein P8188_09670, partial [Gemmatimonadota bacterium]